MTDVSDTATDTPTRSPVSRARCVAAGATHRGMVRRVNEDSFLERSDIGLWLVADGVGGANAGDYASQLVVATFREMAAPEDAPRFLADARARLEESNGRLVARASEVGGMVATTVVLLLVYGWHYTCLWVGDSRGYLYRDGKLRQITRDHSEVQELLDAGVITPEQAANHPRGNVITRAIGAGEELMPDRISGILRAGDRFLLCTDGLSKMVEEEQVAAMLAEPDLAGIPGALIAAALAAGGHDNVTVVVIECETPAAPPSAEPDNGPGQ